MADKNYVMFTRSVVKGGPSAQDETLHLLARALQRQSDVPLEEIKVFHSPDDPMVGLVCPTHSGQWTRFINACKEIWQTEPRRIDATLVARCTTGLLGLAELLFDSVRGASYPVEPTPNDWLVVAQGLDGPAAANLGAQMTYAVAEPSIGSVEHASRRAYIFHAAADPQHPTGLDGLRLSGLFGNAVWLQAVRHKNYRLFVPTYEVPTLSARAVESLVAIFETTPHLLGVTALPEHGLLLALLSQPSSQPKAEGPLPETQVELLRLAGITFETIDLISDGPSRAVQVQVAELVDSETAQIALEAAISEAQKAGLGYRFALTKIRRPELGELNFQQLQGRRESLWQELSKIEARLSKREADQIDRPLLLKFSARQVEAMADVFRCLPVAVMRSGEIKYAFQDGPSRDQSNHYVLIYPRAAAQLSGNPLPLWKELGNGFMEFWLDPHWAFECYDFLDSTVQPCWIFVPKGFALSPAIQTLDPANLDQRLRDLIAQQNIRQVPDPVLIFEESDSDALGLAVTVLSRATFTPVKTQLRWLNDLLTFTHSQPGLATSIHNIAATELVTQAHEQAAKATQAQALLDVAVTETETRIEKRIGEVFTAINVRIDASIQSALGFLANLNQEINLARTRANDELKKIRADIERSLHEAEAAKQKAETLDPQLAQAGQIAAEMQAAARALNARKEEAQQALQQAQAALTELNSQVNSLTTSAPEFRQIMRSVGELQKRYATLEMLLKELLR